MPPPCCGCVRARVPLPGGTAFRAHSSSQDDASIPRHGTSWYSLLPRARSHRAQRNCNTHGLTSPLATDAVVMALMLFALSHFHIHVMSMHIMLPCHVTNKGQLSCDPCALTTTSRPPPLAVFRSVVAWCHHPLSQARKVLQRRALV